MCNFFFVILTCEAPDYKSYKCNHKKKAEYWLPRYAYADSPEYQRKQLPYEPPKTYNKRQYEQYQKECEQKFKNVSHNFMF